MLKVVQTVIVYQKHMCMFNERIGPLEQKNLSFDYERIKRNHTSFCISFDQCFINLYKNAGAHYHFRNMVYFFN